MSDDKLHIDPAHLAVVRSTLAEQGIELTPADLVDAIDDAFAKMQKHLAERGWAATKEELRDFLHANREQLFRPRTFVCSECGRTFPHDPKDPGSGGICWECAQNILDNLPELTEEEKKACDSFDFEKLWKRIHGEP